jgi:hypothetical protein
MSRQEDFIEAGIAYRMEHGKPMCIAGSDLADVERDLNRVKPFEAGCEHGYQYAVDKACEWLSNNLHLVRDWSGTPAQNYRELVRMLRKGMQ